MRMKRDVRWQIDEEKVDEDEDEDEDEDSR